MKSSKVIAIIIAVVAVLWIGSGFLFDKPAPLATEGAQSETEQAAAAPAEKEIMRVRTRTLKAQSYPDIVQVTGRTQASRSVSLSAETSGQVNALLKEEGQTIETGEVLAELELRDRQARVTESRERVNQREIEYNAAKKLAERGFNSKVRLAQALADLENAKAALKDAQVDLGKVKIRSPLDGLISAQGIEIGDYVASGDLLFSLVDLDPIELVGFISERRIQDLTLGAKARAVFLDDTVLEGEMSFIAPAANQDTRTFRVIMSAPNTDLKIKEGLTAKIQIPVAEKMAHKISPSILSLDDEGRIGVKLVNDLDLVEFYPITVLADTEDAMWVTGPPETARFITVGQDFVVVGQKVEAVPAEGEGLL